MESSLIHPLYGGKHTRIKKNRGENSNFLAYRLFFLDFTPTFVLHILLTVKRYSYEQDRIDC